MRCKLAGFRKAEGVSSGAKLSLSHFIERAGRCNPGLAHARGTIRVGCNPPAQCGNAHPETFRNSCLRLPGTQPITQSIDTKRINGLCSCGHVGQ